MARPIKWILRGLGAVVLALVLVVAGTTIWLMRVATPGPAQSLKFERFILLPEHGMLNVLDYLTLGDHALFVSGTSSGSVFKVPLANGAVQEAVGPPRVHGVALTSGLAFVTRSEANVVDVFDAATLRSLKRIPVADDADAILYDPSSRLVYVANGDAQLATLIDPMRKVVVGTVLLGGKPEFPVSDPRSRLVYQNLESTNEVVAVDLTARKVIGRWPLAGCEGPTGLAIDAEANRLFAVCSKNAKFVAFDLLQHRVVASLDIGSGPDSVAFDPGLRRIYSTGLAGELTVIGVDDARRYKVLDRISTHFAAHTLAVDPVSHKVYVGYASLMGPPRIAVFSPRE